MNGTRKIHGFPTALRLAPQKPRPQFATVRFLRAAPRGWDLVRTLRQSAVGFRSLASKNPPGSEHYKKLMAVAEEWDAKANAEQTRLSNLAPAGDFFQPGTGHAH